MHALPQSVKSIPIKKKHCSREASVDYQRLIQCCVLKIEFVTSGIGSFVCPCIAVVIKNGRFGRSDCVLG
jgi:hypothetical protein